MRVAITEFKRNMLAFFRLKQAMFFTFMVPAIFLVLLGYAFDERKFELKVGVVDKDESLASAMFIEGLKMTQALQVTPGEKEDLERRLNEGELVVVLAIKEGFGDQIGEESAELDVLYNQSQLQSSRIVFAILNELLIEMSRRIPGRQPPINFNRIAVQTTSAEPVGYTAFLTPGIIAMSILFVCLVPISNFVAARDSQILKRVSLAPIKKSHYLAGNVLFQVFLCFLMFGFLLAISKQLFGFNNEGSYMTIAVLILVGTASFISLSFAIGSLAKDANATRGLVNMAINPMIFLGGVFYSTAILPSFFQPIIKVLPVTYFVDGLRRVMLQGIGLDQLHKEIAILLAWGAVSYIIAVRKMQWIPSAER